MFSELHPTNSELAFIQVTSAQSFLLYTFPFRSILVAVHGPFLS